MVILWLCCGLCTWFVGYVLGLWFNVSWRNSYFPLADCMHKKFTAVTTTKYSSAISTDDEADR